MDLDAFNRSEWNDSQQLHTVYSSNHSTGHPRMTSEGCPEIQSPNSSSGSSMDSNIDGCTEENMGSEMSENPGQPETNSNQIPVSAPDSFSDHSLNNSTAPFSSQQGYTNPSHGNNPSATSYIPGTTSFNIDYARQMQSPYISGNPNSQNLQTNYCPTMPPSGGSSFGSDPVNRNQGSVYPMFNGFPTPISFQSNEFSVSPRVYGFAESAPHEDIMKPTLTPKEDFCVEHDCERLKGALDRLNIVEKEIVEVMGRRPVVQRIAILQTYKSLYKDNLFAIFNSKLTGYLKDCLIALCYTPAEFDAIELHRAMRGTDTDEDTIIEILCTKTNEQIRRIKDVYPKLFDGCDLMNDVNNQITHPFKRIFMTLLKADRDEFTFVDRNIVQRDVEELSNTIQQNIRIDESKFILILASRSYAHLRVVFNEYIRISKHTMEDTLKLRMRGNALSALLSIVRCIQNKPRYFAEKLFKAMQFVETADKALIRIIVSRCEIDMKNIMKEFYKITGNTLDECIDIHAYLDYTILWSFTSCIQ
ncbi:unnamed protein product [Schistosoma margrebowiei]|uniref:Annexin n=1 Tax=Schistosoma margrebowiei TaxID=48269 RepID=A0AA85AAG7_9TREM|nr:unnamed protein product [Schistosoma margrebowiei]